MLSCIVSRNNRREGWRCVDVCVNVGGFGSNLEPFEPSETFRELHLLVSRRAALLSIVFETSEHE